MADPKIPLETLQSRVEGTFPALLGVEITDFSMGSAAGRLKVRDDLLAPNGYLHAGAVTGFADTLCGLACMGALPEGAVGFTTVELKINFIGTARGGEITADARMVHGGRTTQVWDSTVKDESGKRIAEFRCTQLIIYPPPT